MKPKISVVVPVYKTEDYISQCLQSLVNQTLAEIEIIVIDDGSPDKAGEICDEFAQDDMRIKVYHQENLGGCIAMWNGAQYATADYLMYLDGDDWVEPKTCEVAYNHVNRYQADIVFWSFTKEFPNGLSQRQTPVFERTTVFQEEELSALKRRFVGLLDEELAYPTQTDALSSCWGKLYKRELILHDPFCMIDEKGNHNFDALINIRLFSNVKRVVYIHSFFNHYRQSNPNSATKTHKLDLLTKYIILFGNIKSFIDENNLGQEYYNALSNRIALSVINNALSITSPYLDQSFSKRIDQLKKVLHNKLYKDAINELKISYLPFYWKVYFFFCKKKMIYTLYFFTLIIRKVK